MFALRCFFLFAWALAVGRAATMMAWATPGAAAASEGMAPDGNFVRPPPMTDEDLAIYRNFVQGLAGKSILFLGDSLSWHVFNAFLKGLTPQGMFEKHHMAPRTDMTVYNLRLTADGPSKEVAMRLASEGHWIARQTHGKLGPKPFYQNRYPISIGAESAVVHELPDGQNMTVANFYFYRFALPKAGEAGDEEKHHFQFLNAPPALVRHVISKYDVVVGNMGAWFQNATEKEAYIEQLDELLGAMQSHVAGEGAAGTCRYAVMRETMPSHFAHHGGLYGMREVVAPKAEFACPAGNEKELTKAQKWRNELLHERAALTGPAVTVQEAFKPMLSMWWYHGGNHHPRGKLDCLHYSATPESHLPIMKTLVTAVADQATRRGCRA